MSDKPQVFEVNEQCPACKGTGLYVGMAERDGAAVVCDTCEGTGCNTYRHEYVPFTGRQPREGIVRVFAANPGIRISDCHGLSLLAFGGVPFDDWDASKPFPAQCEMRNYTCPAWWYQCDPAHEKPEWYTCTYGAFPSCTHFSYKHACWVRFDEENA